MSSDDQMISSSNRPYKVIIGILGTLFLGAIGSGLWDLFLRDIVVRLGNLILTMISSMWGGYVEVLHRNIGQLHTDLLTIPLFATAAMVLLTGPSLMVIYFFRRFSELRSLIHGSKQKELLRTEAVSNNVERLRKSLKYVLVPVALISTVTYAITIWQISYTRNAGTWAERSIEIIVPYISPEEHTMLRSQLRSVESAEQFYSLEKRIRENAARAHARLPSFTVIGRK